MARAVSLLIGTSGVPPIIWASRLTDSSWEPACATVSTWAVNASLRLSQPASRTVAASAIEARRFIREIRVRSASTRGSGGSGDAAQRPHQPRQDVRAAEARELE